MLQQGIRNAAYRADKFGLGATRAVYWNLVTPELYESAISRGEAQIVAGGALCAETGVHTGRSPKDKYIVLDDMTRGSVWWDNNGQMSQTRFQVLLDDFIAHSADKTIYAQDLLAGADEAHGLRTRVFTEKAWHSLFIRALLIRPERDALATELTILCKPSFKADPKRHGVRSETVIAIDLSRRIVLIGGSSSEGPPTRAKSRRRCSRH